jgi:hypothetical protein
MRNMVLVEQITNHVQASAAHTLHYRQSEDIAKMTGSRIALTKRGPGAK